MMEVDRFYMADPIRDDGYHTLRGPNGFACSLTEPEDRNWYRDGAEVIAQLNVYLVALSQIVDDGLGGDDALARQWMRGIALKAIGGVS